MITPYVLVNKTDLSIIVKRLFLRDRGDQEAQKIKRFDLLVDGGDEIEANLQRKKCLINQYTLAQGEIIDYMVDYEDDKFKLGLNEGKDDDLDSEMGSNEEASRHLDFGFTARFMQKKQNERKDNIHMDTIGEYKSEYIKIQFDSESNQVQSQRQYFQENREIKKIDLNELGYRAHILRDGHFMEKVFYGVKIVDFKKVFTIRTKYQLVNNTDFDYLVHFRFQNHSILKYMEKGDSLPLSMKYDESRIQIKIIIPEGDSQERVRQKEELDGLPPNFKDFREQSLGYRNWTALIPLLILKERLKFNEGSYLTQGKSLFTFIRKTQ